MNQQRRRALALRQQQLLASSAELRDRVAAEAQPWQQGLARVDLARSWVGRAWCWLCRHPQVPVGVALGVLVLRPRRAVRWCWRWGRRAWWVWMTYRRLAGIHPQPGRHAAGPARLAASVLRYCSLDA